MPLLLPDAKLFDESAVEVMLESYLGQDVLTFDDDKTYEFHRAVERVTHQKFAGHRDSLVLFCNHNGVGSVLHHPKQLARFLRDEAWREIISEIHPGQSPDEFFGHEEEQRLNELVQERLAGKLAETLPSKTLSNLRRWEREEAISS
jgi:hypothetical protein